MNEVAKPKLESREGSVLSERDLELADVPSLVRFAFLAEYEKNDDTPEDHRAKEPLSVGDFENAIRKKNILRGIYKDEKMVAMYWLEPKPENNEMYVDAIFVHPEYRDLGIGTYCLKVVDFEAQKRAFDKCTLTVDPLNGRGVSSYLKNGYQATKYLFNKWGENAHRLFMQKDFATGNRKFADEQKMVRCGDDQRLSAAINDGFVGVSFIRSGDNRDSQIVFRKYA